MTQLKNLRAKKGFTQKEVANLIDIKIRHYQNVEKGNSFLTQEKLNKLEDIFQIPQRVLLAKKVEEIPSFYNHYLSALNTDN